MSYRHAHPWANRSLRSGLSSMARWRTMCHDESCLGKCSWNRSNSRQDKSIQHSGHKSCSNVSLCPDTCRHGKCGGLSCSCTGMPHSQPGCSTQIFYVQGLDPAHHHDQAWMLCPVVRSCVCRALIIFIASSRHQHCRRNHARRLLAMDQALVQLT